MNRLLTFQSVHQALKAERLCQKNAIAARFRPTPRELSVSCGQSMLFEREDMNRILDLFRRERVVWNNLFEISDSEEGISYGKSGRYEDYQLE